MTIERPVARITSSIAILGTLASVFIMFYHGLDVPEAGYGLIGGIVSGASTYLFMSERDDVNNAEHTDSTTNN